MRPLRRIAALLLVLLAPPAATRASDTVTTRAHPEAAARLAAIRTVGLVAPDLKLFELTASNQPVFRPDWTDQGRAVMVAGLTEALRTHGMALKPFDPSAPERKEELREVRLLYDAVTAAVFQATITNQFPAKVARFEYPLGDVSALLDGEQVDAVLFVFCQGVSSSGGRKAIQALGALLAGAYSSGVDRLMVGLVDRSGELIWFGTHEATSYDLRDAHSAGQFASILLEGMRGAAR
ncbi:MAG TPA: hypothetical protein VFP50_04285 [Anaeromyxobacteraceae bacterium]|nr:hypothetical protein [Anaeromyxobacteraceae bacterium]